MNEYWPIILNFWHNINSVSFPSGGCCMDIQQILLLYGVSVYMSFSEYFIIIFCDYITRYLYCNIC